MPRTSEMNTDGIKALLKAELTDAVQALEALLAPHPAAYTGGLTLLTIEDCEAYKEKHHIDEDEQVDEEDIDFWLAVSEHSMPHFADRMQRLIMRNSAIMQGRNQQQETTAVLKALRVPSRTRHVSPPPCETTDGRGKHHTVARRCASLHGGQRLMSE